MISKNFKINDKLPKELDSEKTLITIFYNKTLPQLQEIKKQFPLSTVIGCSTAGEFINNKITTDAVISITKFEYSYFKVFSVNINETKEDIGYVLGTQLKADDLKGIMIFSDGLKVNGNSLIKSIKKVLPDIPLSGGLAGDGHDFTETTVIHNEKLSTDSVVVVGFYGNLDFNCGLGGGWIKFGPLRKVTKSDNNIIYELDNKPALDLYKEYVGKESNNLPESALFYPLWLKDSDGLETTRTVLGINEEDKSITTAADVVQGSTVSLMHADYSELVAGAAECAGMISLDSEENSLSIAFSCFGRRVVLGEYAENELDSLLENTPIKNLIGFYSYGEIAPINNKSFGELHNQSFVLLNIREKVA